ncbi:phosphotransferase family protein [Saccharibacillus alkalitolerans]|uniref:Phosphotransferase n=1 Tax=Saccharibacillus alkalitolerans TaxID=2705290 RepID=A0ABX0F5I5_9BACL|nr:phosphotransferase [Saccharibacillus alkalitolerans]NGZ76201.1 phosphotransferase [Saccharibacillus alkalitolerans]
MNEKHSAPTDIPAWMDSIPGSDGWSSSEPIDKGWSADRKYRITVKDGESLLLRVSDISLAEAKRAEFERVRQAYSLGIPMSRPIAFGLCSGSGEPEHPSASPFAYSLLSWIEGEDAESLLPGMMDDEAYRLGRGAGEWLRRMHGLNVPVDAKSPGVSVRRQFERKKAAYARCGYRLPFDDALLKRIEARLPLLDGVKPGFRQGDYHPGNMILGPDGGLNIIDFNRSDIGDPIRDFNRLETFTSRISLPFARGQLDGYLESGPRDPDFFGRMALYCAMECLFAIVWAVPFGEPEIGDTLKRSERIWEDFEGFERNVPVWYEGS